MVVEISKEVFYTKTMFLYWDHKNFGMCPFIQTMLKDNVLKLIYEIKRTMYSVLYYLRCDSPIS